MLHGYTTIVRKSLFAFVILLLAALPPLETFIDSLHAALPGLTARTAQVAALGTYLAAALAIVGVFLGINALIDRRSAALGDALNCLSEHQAAQLDAIPERRLPLWVFASAGLGLFFELALIRWQATLFPLFAFYKNFSLIACFFGLGLGYALSGARTIPLVAVIPLFAFQAVAFMMVRYGFSVEGSLVFRALPILEQSNMGLSVEMNGVMDVLHLLPTYALLACVYLFTAATLVPIGQWCGRLMDRLPRLQAYGCNLGGSIAGVALFFLASLLWTPPQIWFAPVLGLLLVAQLNQVTAARIGAVSAITALAALCWPVQPENNRIHSPYQLIEQTINPSMGWMEIRAAGHYYQRVFDFARDKMNTATNLRLKTVAEYYELPYRFTAAPERVAIVGAGSGNDVAAALRMNAGHVDAIEIDPAILMLGRHFHPEHPYSSPKVRIVNNDARNFFRTTRDRFDVVVYGVLDSHAAASHASSVRLDSFVYTQEGLREAYGRLKDGGVLYLSFALLGPAQGEKIYRMLSALSPEHPPVALSVGYDSQLTTAFVIRKNAPLAFNPSALPFEDVTARYANPQARVDIPTDDWPFFYMLERVYPLSYLPVLAIMLALTVWATRRVMPQVTLARGNVPFFFLGAGFMLVETKAITELGLTFGNTWHVIGLTILSVLGMAYLANLLAMKRALGYRPWYFSALIATIALGWTVAKGIVPMEGGPVIDLAKIILLTAPMFFSGIVFSTLLGRSKGDMGGIMAYNLMGAILGGALEYNAMYFGYAALYVLAAALYAAAWVTTKQRFILSK